jgi:hypothetical protein
MVRFERVSEDTWRAVVTCERAQATGPVGAAFTAIRNWLLASTVR